MEFTPEMLGQIVDAAAQKVFEATGLSPTYASGGGLNEEQQGIIIRDVRRYTVMLAPNIPLADFPTDSPIGEAFAAYQGLPPASVTGGQPALVPGGCSFVTHANGHTAGTFDLAHLGEPITRRATENTVQADQYRQNAVKFGRRRFECEKVQFSWGFTTDMLLNGLAGNNLPDMIRGMVSARVGQDWEHIAIEGDATAAPVLDADDNETLYSRLLRCNDGWYKISLAECQSVDCDGDFIDEFKFSEALLKRDRGLQIGGWRWIGGMGLYVNWVQHLQVGLATGNTVAAQALGGQSLAPYGVPFLMVPTIPEQLALPKFAVATPARILSRNGDSFVFTATAYKIRLDINNVGAVTIVFPNNEDTNVQNRYQQVFKIAKAINDQLVAAYASTAYSNVARIDQHGRLELVAPTLNGNDSEIDITEPADSAVAMLGFAVGVTVGQAAAAGNSLDQGTFVWLSPTKNFAFHVVTALPGSTSTGIRLYSEFRQSQDATVNDGYAYIDATIVDPRATILMKYLRVAPPGVNPVNS